MNRALLMPTAAMLVVLTVASMAIFTVAVFAPAAAADIGVDATAIGVFTAITYVFAMISGALASGLIDRFGPVRVSQAAMALTASGMLVLTVSTPAAAAIAALGLGLSYGTLNPASAHILIGLASARWRALVFSVKQTGVPVGGALAGLCVPLLVAATGWRGAALAVCAAAVCAAVAIQPLRARFDAARAHSRRWSAEELLGPLRMVWAHRELRRFAIAGFGYAGVQVSVGAFYVVFLNQHVGMSLLASGVVFAFVQAGGIAGRILWGALAGRWLTPRVVLAALGPLTCACLLATSALRPHWPAAGLALLGLVLGASSFGWNGVFLAELARHAPAGRAGEATGGVQFVFFSGVVLVPPAFGALVAASGSYTLAFVAVAALALAAGVYLLGLRPPGAADRDAG